MIEFFLATTLHFGLGEGWNEIHPGVRYTDNQWTVGAFLNSENTASLYGSYTFENGPWFAEIGAATGYSDYPVVPFVRAGREINENTRLFIAPGIAGKRGGIVVGVEISMPVSGK